MDYLIRASKYLEANPTFKLIGRDDDIDRLSAILMRSTANSVVLVGAGGVGVTSILHGLQALKSRPEAPFDIVAKKLFWLDTDGLFSNGDTAEVSRQFKKITDRLERTSDSVLMIEDTRDFIEGCRNSGCSHFINDLMASVKNGLNQVIFETRDDDLDMVLKLHSDVREMFTLLDIREPSSDSLLAITNKSAQDLATYHGGIKIDDDAVTTAIELTNKYRTRDPGLSRAQPERSATLLDRALATYRLKAHLDVPEDVSKELRALYRNQRDGEEAIVEFEEEIEKIMEQSARNNADTDFKLMEPQAVTDYKKKIATYQTIIDENRAAFVAKTAEINQHLVLTKELVMQEFARISGISTSKLGEDEREKLRGLEQVLKNRIFGQDTAVVKLTNAIKTARVVKRSKDQPQAAFMFIGPSGTGKTEIAKALTEALLDDEKALTRFDMSEYSQKHDVAKLCGAPPGFEGFEAGGILTNLMRQNPNRVILFDEIEKADDSIYDIFLAILSDSRLTDNVGRTVSFNDATLIFTSNIGQPHFLDKTITFEEAQERAIGDLNQRYRAEFLNRFNGRQHIVCFNRLGVEHIEKIVAREISKLSEAYRQSGVDVSMDSETIVLFCSDVYDPVLGARGLPGFINAHLEPVLANLILDGFAGKVEVTYDKERRTFNVEKGA